MKFPPAVHAEVLGESTELNAAQDRLYTFGIGAAIAIFLLLQAAFGSLRLAALTFLLLPMALVGGVLAVWLGDGVLSLGSLVGFLTIFGIAARNGILMISHFQHLERAEGVPFGPALVLRGAKERLAPIMMTALATGLALVPLAVAGSLPGHEIEHPMAIVILGGLVTSTLLNLFVLPSLYLRFAKSRKERRAAQCCRGDLGRVKDTPAGLRPRTRGAARLTWLERLLGVDVPLLSRMRRASAPVKSSMHSGTVVSSSAADRESFTVSQISSSVRPNCLAPSRIVCIGAIVDPYSISAMSIGYPCPDGRKLTGRRDLVRTVPDDSDTLRHT